MPEPKTCPCRACCYQKHPTWSEWWWEGCKQESHVVTFCPICGAHLLPNGEVEPRGEVVGEAVLLHEPGTWRVTDIALLVGGIEGDVIPGVVRVLLVRPADPPDEPEGDGDDESINRQIPDGRAVYW